MPLFPITLISRRPMICIAAAVTTMGLLATVPANAAPAPAPAAPIAYKDDRLGINLPTGLDADTLIGLVMPMGDRSRVTLVGVKPWPRRADSYVVIVCAANDGAPISGAPDCDRESVGPSADEKTLPVAYVGVIEHKAGQPPSLVAASGAITMKTDWSTSAMPLPLEAEEAADGQVVPSFWQRFDLAAYRITDDDYAFGLRAGWSESFPGGGASFDALYLFKIEANRLAVILAEPMFAYRNISGEWNKDGTRDSEIEDVQNILAVSKRKTDGYYDLRITRKGDKSFGKTLKWSPRAGRYLTAE